MPAEGVAAYALAGLIVWICSFFRREGIQAPRDIAERGGLIVKIPMDEMLAVSYTHLTLPTIHLV